MHRDGCPGHVVERDAAPARLHRHSEGLLAARRAHRLPTLPGPLQRDRTGRLREAARRQGRPARGRCGWHGARSCDDRARGYGGVHARFVRGVRCDVPPPARRSDGLPDAAPPRCRGRDRGCARARAHCSWHSGGGAAPLRYPLGDVSIPEPCRGCGAVVPRMEGVASPGAARIKREPRRAGCEDRESWSQTEAQTGGGRQHPGRSRG